MSKPSDFAGEIACVLDDDLDAPVRSVLAFEQALRAEGVVLWERCTARLVYRDWLDERGCRHRAAMLDAELHMLARKLEALDTEEAREALHRLRPNLRAFDPHDAYPLHRGHHVLRYPEGFMIGDPGQEVPASQIARELVERMLESPGGIVMLPNSRDMDGNFLWDYTGPLEVRRDETT